jgi:hypothetical protein
MHVENCLEHEDGPCTCGLEEVLEDEAWEEAKEHLDPEDW